MEIKNYISKVWPYKVEDVYVSKDIQFKEKDIDGLVAELFSKNLDGEKEVTGKAAMTIQRLRQIPESKIDIIERDAGKEMMKKVFYNICSEDYSKNTSAEKYLEFFKEPSLKEIIFKPEKNCGNYMESLKYWGHRNYKFSKTKNQFLFEVRVPKNSDNSFDVNNWVGIVFDKEDFVKHHPSEKINDYLKQVDSEFPYPRKGESNYGYIDKTKLGVAINRYFPDLRWYELNLREGEFKDEHWSAIFSGLRDSGFMENDLKYFKENKYLLGKTYSFVAPIGKFELNIQRKKELEFTGIDFSYNDQYLLPGFKIINAKIYPHKDIDPFLFSFPPD